ncbi:DUF1542 domain-containing protein [Leucobacter insecticola]|uniref:DUF1542 domain-containing protein n=1 Tax=Leucobacter insecticola TaxID=2714934 RepID=A0A6G8FLG9_9MICO|nr:DUF1542 domain-containing protein [Leucobacter insecticola]
MDGVYSDLAAQDQGNVDLAKDKATSDLDKAAAVAKDAIDALQNLSAEEKAAAKTAIDQATTAAKDAVSGASTAADAAAASAAGQSTVAEVVTDATLRDAKLAAVKELDAKAASVKKAIDALTTVSEADKAAAKAAVDRVLAAAKEAVNAAPAAADANAASKAGKLAMDDVLIKLTSSSEGSSTSAVKPASPEQPNNGLASTGGEIQAALVLGMLVLCVGALVLSTRLRASRR